MVERMVCDPNCAGENVIFPLLTHKEYVTLQVTKCVGVLPYQEILYDIS